MAGPIAAADELILPAVDSSYQRWQIGWLPGFYQVSATGLDSNASGYGIGIISAAYEMSQRNRLAADVTVPLNSSDKMPGLFLLHTQIEHYVRIQEQTTLQAVFGFIYFGQTLPSSQQDLAYKENLTFLTSLAAPYIGAKVHSQFCKKTAFVGEVHLIPVPPVGDDLFSIAEEANVGIEQSFGPITGVVRGDWGRYEVHDKDLGDLNSTYLSFHVGILYAF